MRNVILTFALFALCISGWAQAPKQNLTNESGKAAASGSLPAFVISEEVKFNGEGTTLAGTIFLPKANSGQKVPAILMLTEFYSSRDGLKVAAGIHSTYRDMALHFVERGFAVLRFDRRCTGKSSCEVPATLAIAADDGYAAVQYLGQRPEINKEKIIVFGHGDGAFLAASIAGREGVAGLIATSAFGRNFSKIVREWAAMKLKDKNATEAEIAKYLQQVEAVIKTLVSGGVNFDKLNIDPKDELLTSLTKHPDYSPSWLLDDPLGAYQHIAGSVLIVHGAKDRRVPVRENSYIRDALQFNDQKDHETKILPNMDYFLKENKGEPGLAAEDDISRPIDPALLKLIDEWLARKFKINA